jgi:hypothetical protein
VMLKPTLDVDVANPEMFNPLSVVVPKPPSAISRAEMVVVELPTAVVVDIYSVVPVFLNTVCARPAPAESES